MEGYFSIAAFIIIFEKLENRSCVCTVVPYPYVSIIVVHRRFVRHTVVALKSKVTVLQNVVN